MTAGGEPGRGWTVVLRRMPARIVAGQPEGGYTNAFEIVCCHCGDDPDLDYRDVSPELQRIRGPYQPIAAGAAAYEKHVALHPRRASPSVLTTSSAAQVPRTQREIQDLGEVAPAVNRADQQLLE